MAFAKKLLIKFSLVVVVVSLLLMYMITPFSYAKITLDEDEFYYSGTTEGKYTVKEGFLAWLLAHIGDIADWLLGLMTMMPRMVFVGWTALFEQGLKWAFETTMGVSVDGDVVGSATDLSNITDSSKNITVEAIVYNKVPALSINFFDLEIDKKTSGTGQLLICEKCKKAVDECSSCGCGCGTSGAGCEPCQEYAIQSASTYKPIVIQLREVVATWYYGIRLLTLAAMLITLIMVGIKMALSTIASDKAVYKRMLVDWCVGMLIVFTIHYIMLAIIAINNILVNVIQEAQKNMTAVELQRLSGSTSDLTDKNQALEIELYETIRTRAYDPRMSIGWSGMFMYMTLVYFAVKYSVMYVKRLLTVYVLAMMAPAIGVSYALQKVLSGRAASMKKWITEFTLNVIIQTVHALIYAIFISEALILSMESVPGMIVALIFMNFALKAEKIFRKVFKMGGDGSGLFDHTAAAGDPGALRSGIQNAAGLAMGAKPIAKALGGAPQVKLAKAIGQGVAVGAAKARGKVSEVSGKFKDPNSELNKNIDQEHHFGKKVESKIDKRADKLAAKDAKKGNRPQDSEAYRAQAEQQLLKKKKFRKLLRQRNNAKAMVNARNHDDYLKETGSEALAHNVDLTAEKVREASRNGDEEAWQKAMSEHRQAKMEYARFVDISVSTADGTVESSKQKVANEISEEQERKAIMGSAYKKIFGTPIKDTKTGATVAPVTNYGKLGVQNRYNLSNDEMKKLQEYKNLCKAGLLGVGSMFLGMGTIVAHPEVGMGLMVGGMANASKLRKLKPMKNRKYTFNRFPTDTLEAIRSNVLLNSDFERRMVMASSLESSFKRLAVNMGNNNIKVGTIGTVIGSAATIGFAPATLLAGATVAGTAFVASRLSASVSSSELARSITSAEISRQLAAEKEFDASARGEIARSGIEGLNKKYDKILANDGFAVPNSEIEKEFGRSFNPITGMIEKTNSSEETEAINSFNEALNNSSSANGVSIDSKSGRATSADDAKIETSDLAPDMEPKEAERLVNMMNLQVDATISEMMLSSDGTLDVNKDFNKILLGLNDRLIKAGLVTKDKPVEKVVDESRLKEVISKRSKTIKKKNDSVDAAFDLALEEKIAAEGGDAATAQEKKDKVKKELKEAIKKSQEGKKKVNIEEILTNAGMDTSEENQALVEEYSERLQDEKTSGDASIKGSKKKSEPITKIISDLADKSATEMVDTINELQSTLDTYIVSGETGKVQVNTADGGVELDQTQANQVVELLLMTKELQMTNNRAKDKIALESTSTSFKRKKIEQEHARIETLKSKADLLSKENALADAKKGNATRSEISRLERDITVLEQKVEASQKLEVQIGKEMQGSCAPVVNVSGVLKDLSLKRR